METRSNYREAGTTPLATTRGPVQDVAALGRERGGIRVILGLRERDERAYGEELLLLLRQSFQDRTEPRR